MSDEANSATGCDETDTLISVGEPVPCRYFDPAGTDEGADASQRSLPFCRHFQINPRCEGDLNKCDVLMFAPDPRDGYR